MSDITTLMREQLQTNWKGALDIAVQNGDVEGARKASDKLAELASSAVVPKTAPPFSEADIRKVLETKAPWFGVDPRKSAKAIDFAKSMHLGRFATAEAFAAKLIEAIEADEKQSSAAATAPAEGEGDPPEGEGGPPEGEGEGEPGERAAAGKRKTDPHPELRPGATRRATGNGPWTKLADAPKDVADTIRKQMDKFTRNATKEQREKFQQDALASAYRVHQAKRGK